MSKSELKRLAVLSDHLEESGLEKKFVQRMKNDDFTDLMNLKKAMNAKSINSTVLACIRFCKIHFLGPK